MSNPIIISWRISWLKCKKEKVQIAIINMLLLDVEILLNQSFHQSLFSQVNYCDERFFN